MNEGHFKLLRKNLKNSDNSTVSVGEVVSVYLKPEREEPLFVKESYFDMLDQDDQDFLMANFRKTVTGRNKKIFELKFEEDVEDSTHDTLNEMLEVRSLQDFSVQSNNIINKIIDNFTYEYPIVVHIARFRLGTQDGSLSFIVGTTNKVENPKGQYALEYEDGSDNNDLTTTYSTNPVVNMNSPIDGFLYPTLEEGGVNVNRIINYHKKLNETNANFITNVLNAKLVLTAKEEKNYFHLILKKLLGDKVKPQILHEMYSVIYRTYETEEDSDHRVLHRDQLLRILESQDIVIQEDIQDVFEEVLGVQNYGFKVDNIVPDFSKKSFEIHSDEADIQISPRDLNKVRQVRSEDGQMYLMVEIHRDSAEGLSFDLDEVSTITFNEN